MTHHRAEVLRRAASLMRERTAAVRNAAAEPEQWFGADEIAASFEFSGVGDMGDARSDAEHIASWHPVVTDSVADWLDVTAKDVGTSSLSFHAALAVARAYLGSDS